MGRQGAYERADRVGEEGEEEMFWRQQMDSRGETLCIAHVDAGWRRKNMGACYDESHIDDAAEHQADHDRQTGSEYGVHVSECRTVLLGRRKKGSRRYLLGSLGRLALPQLLVFSRPTIG